MPIISTVRIRAEIMHLENGASAGSLVLATGANTAAHCIYYNGLDAFVIFINGSSEQSINRLGLNNNTFVVKETRNINSFATILDACFDGVFYWTLDATNVTQYTDPMLYNQVKQWAHGLGTARGITTDGQNILITS